MVFKSKHFNCGLNGFVLFVHRTVLMIKRTVLVRSSKLLGLDHTVRFGSENYDYDSIICKVNFVLRYTNLQM